MLKLPSTYSMLTGEWAQKHIKILRSFFLPCATNICPKNWMLLHDATAASVFKPGCCAMVFNCFLIIHCSHRILRMIENLCLRALLLPLIAATINHHFYELAKNTWTGEFGCISHDKTCNCNLEWRMFIYYWRWFCRWYLLLISI